jgi:aryl-alcohol dehydrogenase-like predicted oxidoreductase
VAWVDTAYSCGDGSVEREVGRWLAALPPDERPAVFTKGGIVADGTSSVGRCISALHPSVLRSQLDATLLALRLDAVDAFLLHYPDETGVPVEASWEALVGMVAEGKVRRAGLCAFGLDALRSCESMRHVDLFMSRVDPFRLEQQLPCLEWCEEHDVEVVAWVAGEESRAFDPSYSGPLVRTPYTRSQTRLQRLLAASVSAEMMALATVRDVARKLETTPEGVVAGWLLSQPGVTGIAVGAESGTQLDRWLADGHASLEREDIERITSVAGEALSTP